jgi:hypothetical protein
MALPVKVGWGMGCVKSQLRFFRPGVAVE